jgi:hypothetical protein
MWRIQLTGIFIQYVSTHRNTRRGVTKLLPQSNTTVAPILSIHRLYMDWRSRDKLPYRCDKRHVSGIQARNRNLLLDFLSFSKEVFSIDELVLHVVHIWLTWRFPYSRRVSLSQTHKYPSVSSLAPWTTTLDGSSTYRIYLYGTCGLVTITMSTTNPNNIGWSLGRYMFSRCIG